MLLQKLNFLLVLFVTAAEMAAADLATKDWLFHTSASGTQLGMRHAVDHFLPAFIQ
jgi:hypothetical protein